MLRRQSRHYKSVCPEFISRRYLDERFPWPSGCFITVPLKTVANRISFRWFPALAELAGQRRPWTRLMASARVRALSRKTPRTAEVTVRAPGLRTPRIGMDRD